MLEKMIRQNSKREFMKEWELRHSYFTFENKMTNIFGKSCRTKIVDDLFF